MIKLYENANVQVTQITYDLTKLLSTQNDPRFAERSKG